MKTTRIDIEGPSGTATLTRDGRQILIAGKRLVRAIETAGGKTCLVKESFRLLADARDTDVHHRIAAVARNLQRNLDGYAGTEGDVAEYRRAIQMLAD